VLGTGSILWSRLGLAACCVTLLAVVVPSKEKISSHCPHLYPGLMRLGLTPPSGQVHTLSGWRQGEAGKEQEGIPGILRDP